MKLLLKVDVQGLGVCGDDVEVKDGYAKNFLIPNDQAILATPKNLKKPLGILGILGVGKRLANTL